MFDEKLKRIEAAILPEIYVCQTALVNEALKQGFFLRGDIQNLSKPFDSELLDPAVCFVCKMRYECLDSETGLCRNCYKEYQEPQEIYAWWLVSEWLAEKLRCEGGPVLKNKYGRWWGRCQSGQALFMDDVIHAVYDKVMQKEEE